ncbi:hypothetical protein ABIB25_003557 [Nakamurella sp. UYEF19]|uniref:WcbI family polysaccharide biosynthesis putative acetyltransferase n=1 Tax=Nakamurella sp. UYEF19 TaxID=1756392 RepID=UPI0033928CFE
MSTITGRRRHYGSFYGIDGDAFASGTVGSTRNVLVYGNCQAEAVRVLLAGSATSPVNTMRVPPVFELEPSDIPHLRSAAARAHILIGQPVRDQYHDLPLGTRQVAAMMPPGGLVIHFPVIRFAGLHPYQAIVRDPRDPSHDPPVVPYHDLRTLAEAVRGPREVADLSARTVLAVGEASRAELARREDRDCDVTVSDLFRRPEFGDMATINHPGNRILLELARRLQGAMGLPPEVVEPGRPLLGEVVAPVDRAVSDGWQLPGSVADHWIVRGRAVSSRSIHDAQIRWYVQNPDVVRAGMDRHGSTMDLLGLR